MALLPVDTRTKTEIAIEDGLVEQDFRPYLGISSLGKNCSRELWYGFRLCGKEKITPRQDRLFKRGHREEPIIQADLRSIGIVCHVDQNNQPEVVCCNGHCKGHCDDVLTRVPDAPKTAHLGEYKTHNDKSFTDLVKKGLKLSKPVHYAQMIAYMDKLKLTRGLYVAVNKNDDRRYYERISENPEYASKLFAKAEMIINAKTPPDRIGNANWYECKWCSFYLICHFGEQPLVNCRTCRFVEIKANGLWSCSGHKIQLTFEQQKLGCGRHKFMECLLP